MYELLFLDGGHVSSVQMWFTIRGISSTVGKMLVCLINNLALHLIFVASKFKLLWNLLKKRNICCVILLFYSTLIYIHIYIYIGSHLYIYIYIGSHFSRGFPFCTSELHSAINYSPKKWHEIFSQIYDRVINRKPFSLWRMWPQRYSTVFITFQIQTPVEVVEMLNAFYGSSVDCRSIWWVEPC